MNIAANFKYRMSNNIPSTLHCELKAYKGSNFVSTRVCQVGEKKQEMGEIPIKSRFLHSFVPPAKKISEDGTYDQMPTEIP